MSRSLRSIEHQVSGPDRPMFSATRTLGALVTGVAAYRTRDLVRTGRKMRAVAALDPTFRGDEAGFREACGANRHAPDLRR